MDQVDGGVVVNGKRQALLHIYKWQSAVKIGNTCCTIMVYFMFNYTNL